MSQRQRLLLILLLLLAAGLRLGRWSEERDNLMARVPSGDERSYDQWGQELAQGQGQAQVPYQAPLQAYALAAAHSVFSPPAARDVVRLLGALLGVGTVFLAFLCGQRVGRDYRVGLVAAALTATHQPAIYYEATLLRDGAASFLATLATYQLLRLSAPARPRTEAFALGVVLGVGTLWRENLLLLALLCLALLAPILPRSSPRRRATLVALASLGFLLPLLPLLASNYRLERQFSPLTTWNGGCVFYIANHRANPRAGYSKPAFVPQANPEGERAGFRRVAEERVGHSLTPHEISSYWLHEGLREIWAAPGIFASKVVRRGLYLLASQEYVHARDPRLDRRDSLILSLPLPGFGLLVAFGGLGLWRLRRQRALLALLPILSSVAGTLLLVAFASRYRLPLVPALSVLAAIGFRWAAEQLRKNSHRPLVGATLLTVGLTLVSVPYEPATSLFNRALVWSEMGQPERASDEVRQIRLPLRPAYWERLAELRWSNGERRPARDAFLEVLALRPDRARSWAGLSQAEASLGHPNEALSAAREAARLEPANPAYQQLLEQLHR